MFINNICSTGKDVNAGSLNEMANIATNDCFANNMVEATRMLSKSKLSQFTNPIAPMNDASEVEKTPSENLYSSDFIKGIDSFSIGIPSMNTISEGENTPKVEMNSFKFVNEIDPFSLNDTVQYGNHVDSINLPMAEDNYGISASMNTYNNLPENSNPVINSLHETKQSNNQLPNSTNFLPNSVITNEISMINFPVVAVNINQPVNNITDVEQKSVNMNSLNSMLNKNIQNIFEVTNDNSTINSTINSDINSTINSNIISEKDNILIDTKISGRNENQLIVSKSDDLDLSRLSQDIAENKLPINELKQQNDIVINHNSTNEIKNSDKAVIQKSKVDLSLANNFSQDINPSNKIDANYVENNIQKSTTKLPSLVKKIVKDEIVPTIELNGTKNVQTSNNASIIDIKKQDDIVVSMDKLSKIDNTKSDRSNDKSIETNSFIIKKYDEQNTNGFNFNQNAQYRTEENNQVENLKTSVKENDIKIISEFNKQIIKSSAQIKGERPLQRTISNVRLEDFPKLAGRLSRSLMPDGSQNIKLTMSPVGLGTLFVKIEVHDNKLNLNISSDSADTLSKIENGLSALKENIAKEGLKLDNIDFSKRESDNFDNLNFLRQEGGREDNEEKRKFVNSFKPQNVGGKASEPDLQEEAPPAISSESDRLERYV